MSKELDEILIRYRQKTDAYYSEYTDGVITLDEWIEVRDDIQIDTKQALHQELMAIVGEDEYIDPREALEAVQMKIYANRLRQELRQKISEFTGVTDE